MKSKPSRGTDRTCVELDCDKPRHARNLCGGHYQAWRLHLENAAVRGNCVDPNCDRPVYAKNLCQKHYDRVRRGRGFTGDYPPEPCPVCGTEFTPASRKRTFCSPACAAKAAYWRDGGRRSRIWTIAKKYGVTPEIYEALERDQGGKCAICDQSPATDLPQTAHGRTHPDGNLHVDHDHATGVVRGLLCGPCNKALGALQDDPGRLRAAAAYIEKHRSSDARSDDEPDQRLPIRR